MLKLITGVKGKPQPCGGTGDLWWGTLKSGDYTYAKFVARVSRAQKAKLKQGEAVPLRVFAGSVSDLGPHYVEYRQQLHEPPYYWAFRSQVYSANLRLKPADVVALALEAENKTRLRLEKAHALMAMRKQLDNKARRQPIPQEVKVAVWQRDAGRCVQCRSQKDLEYDHIIPLAMGGSNTDRNLQLLCAACNRRKGATLG